MLMAEAFASLLKCWDNGELPSLSDEFVRDGIMICLYQALVRTLLAQNEDGSWGSIGSREETAYGVLLVSKASVLQCIDSIRPNIDFALESARRFIQSSSEERASYLWVEKVTYGSEVLCESYLLAALRANVSETELSTKTESLVQIPEASVAKFVKFYSKTPLFSTIAPWKLRASLIEGYLFLPQLKKMRLNIFPRNGMDEDNYFEYIPFTWTANNNFNKTFLSTESLREMMVISFLNYQADEYMEAVVGTNFGTRKKEILSIIDDIFTSMESKDGRGTKGFREAASRQRHALHNFTSPIHPTQRTITTRRASKADAQRRTHGPRSVHQVRDATS